MVLQSGFDTVSYANSYVVRTGVSGCQWVLGKVIDVNKMAAAGISYGARTIISQTQEKISSVAWVISEVSGPLAEVIGQTLDYCPSLISFGGFSYLTLIGGQMVAVPFTSKAKWYNIESRFKRQPVLKTTTINLSELINKDSLKDSIGNIKDDIKDFANLTIGQAETIANVKEAAAAQVRKNANIALEKVNYAKQNLSNAQEQNEWIKTISTLDSIKKLYSDELSTAITKYEASQRTATELETLAEKAEKDFQVASEQLKKIKEMQSFKKTLPAKEEKKGSSGNLLTNNFITNYLHTGLSKSSRNWIAEPYKVAYKSYKGTELIVSSEEKKKHSPENFMNKHSIEMSEPKSGQFPIPLPMSDEAFVIYYEEMKKEFTKSAAGISMVGIGVLGNLDTLGWSDHVLNPHWSFVASVIGAPVHLASTTIGKVAGWVGQNDHWGVGKLVTAGGLCFISYKLFENTKLVWFNFAKDKQGPKIKKDVIVQDIGKLLLSASFFTAGVYNLNNFIQGK